MAILSQETLALLEVLNLIPPDARLVVEVGERPGPLAEAFRRINPEVDYVTLGPSLTPLIGPTALEGPVDNLTLTWDGNNNQADLDVIIFNNTLEHLTDPKATLARLVPRLKADGQVLLRVMNAQHWSILVSLLRDQWSESEGPRTLLSGARPFTLATIRDLLSSVDLEPFEIEPVLAPASDFDAFLQIMRPVVDALGVAPDQFRIQSLASHYIVRARRPVRPLQRMLIQTLIGEPIVCARVRIHEPHACLRTIPGVRILSTEGMAVIGAALPDEQKIFIRQRTILHLPRDLISQRRLLENNFLIISEFDDDPSRFPEIAAHDHFTFRSCHAVQTSSDLLAETLRANNPHVEVFPNQLATLPEPRTQRENGSVRIFFGALNRENDWAAILPALNRVLESYGSQVHFQVVYDRLFFEAIRTEHKSFEPLCSYRRYEELLRTCDIALLPLEANRFNARKSDLKFIECAAHGVVVVASPTVYGDSVDHGRTGLLYHDPESFAVALETLILNLPLRKRIAVDAYADIARDRLLSRHYRRRLEWYLKLLDRRLTLDQELRERLPILFSD